MVEGRNEGAVETWQRRPAAAMERLPDIRFCDGALLDS